MTRTSGLITMLLATLCLAQQPADPAGVSERQPERTGRQEAPAASATPASSETEAIEETVKVQLTAEQAENFPTLQQRNPRYELRPGDELEVAFPFTPEFNQKLAVQPDGFVTLLEAGDLLVAGMNVPELRAALDKAYKGILREPQIRVSLTKFEKPYFVASGELKSPGKYELTGPTSLTQAVAMAGGFTEQAKHSQVLLFRRQEENWLEVKKVNVKRLLARAELAEDLQLQPGDMVYVPQSMLSKLKGWVIPRAVIGPTFRPGQ